MPRREVDMLQASYDLIWRHHRLDPLQALRPDFEWVVPGYLEGEVKRGPDEVTAFFEEWIDSFDAMEVDYEFREAPDGRVLALVDMRGVGRESGAATEMRMAQLWSFEDGRARRMVFYDDRAEALAAAGLAPRSFEDLIQLGIEAVNRDDVETVLAQMAEDVVWQEDPDWPDGATWHGRDGVRRVLTERMDSAGFHVELEDVVERGDRALVLMRWTLQGRSSGAAADLRPAMIYTFRDNLVSRIEFFIDRDRARAAFAR